MKLNCRYSYKELKKILVNQVYTFWNIDLSEKLTEKILTNTLGRLEVCFANSQNKYINLDGNIKFEPLHSTSYSIFLYFLSNELYLSDNEEAASCIYYLNKIMHSIDWFYAIDLPEIFMAEHPIGSVLGRAQYSNYFMIYQGCTVGGNRRANKIFYPRIGEHVIMYSNSTIIGETTIGNYVIISSGTYIKNENIPDNCIVFGQSPNLVIKERSVEEMKSMFLPFWTK